MKRIGIVCIGIAVLFAGIVLLPSRVSATGTVNLIVNGGFETGDWTGWIHGGVLSQNITTRLPHSGTYCALLGDPNYGNGNIPVGPNWCYQSLSLSSNIITAQLSFWYHIETYDNINYDWFDVYIKDGNGMQLACVVHDAWTGSSGTYHDLGWKYATYDLTPFVGQTIALSLEFSQSNNYDDCGNTWVSLDDVSVLATGDIDVTPPTITIISPFPGLYNSDQTLIFTVTDDYDTSPTVTSNYPSGTLFTIDGTYTVDITAEDDSGNVATATLTFSIDKTPPELRLHYDVASQSIVVKGMDNMDSSLTETSTIVGQNGCKVQVEYTFTDDAGNCIYAVIEVKDKKWKDSAKVLQVGYNGNQAISIPDNCYSNLHVKKPNHLLFQCVYLKNEFIVISHYMGKKDTTRVTEIDLSPLNITQNTFAGTVIVDMVTDNGALNYMF